jgi:hypothetical protein
MGLSLHSPPKQAVTRRIKVDLPHPESAAKPMMMGFWPGARAMETTSAVRHDYCQGVSCKVPSSLQGKRGLCVEGGLTAADPAGLVHAGDANMLGGRGEGALLHAKGSSLVLVAKGNLGT